MEKLTLTEAIEGQKWPEAARLLGEELASMPTAEASRKLTATVLKLAYKQGQLDTLHERLMELNGEGT